MPRSNRPRGRQPDAEPEGELNLDRLVAGIRRTESKRAGMWNVQRISAPAARKVYVCPGCRLDVPLGQAHVVAWRADGLMGENDDLAGRRHWHAHCWRVEP